MLHFILALKQSVDHALKGVRRHNAFSASVILLIIVLISTGGFYYLEKEQDLTALDSLWLSLVTMTTVGYGDISPQTPAGRLFALIITMACGIGIMAYIASMLAATIIEKGARRLKGQVNLDVADHILIINCPNVDKVRTIIDNIRADPKTHNRPVVLISDTLEEIPEQLLDLEDFYFVSGNPLLLRTLERANAISAVRAIILAKDTKDPHSDGLTTQVALILESMHKQANKDIYTVAEAVSKDSVNVLRRAGVEDVVCLETFVSPILVQSLIDPGYCGAFSELLSNEIGPKYFVDSIGPLKGRPYKDIREFFQKNDHYGVIPVGILRTGKSVINPPGATLIEEDDRLFYIAEGRTSLNKAISSI